jgi:hypothetical protein
MRHALYDTKFWKSFIHVRLGQAIGDPGCLSLFGREAEKHRMLAEHLTAKKRERLHGSTRGRCGPASATTTYSTA